MKWMLTVVLFLIVTLGYSQDSTKVEAPFIVTKLLFGSELGIDNLRVKFVNVINDSRCPKNVNCVRAGEAEVQIEIYKEDKLIETKVIEITPTTHLFNELPILGMTNNSVIKGYNLLPYPELGISIQKKDYTFQVIVEN